MGLTNSTRFNAVVLGCVFAAGCSTVSTVDVPQIDQLAPPSWAIVEPAPITTSITEYWAALDDPLITKYVEQSIENNLDLAAASARVTQARAGVRAARAGYFPQLNGSGSVSRDIGDFAEDDLRFSLGVDASWETNLFGRIGFDVAANREVLRASEYALADLQRLIVGQVVQSTVSARALAVQRDIAVSTLEVQNENLQIAQWRLQAGLVSSLDVEQAKAQRGQTAALIPALERDLVAAANSISVLIGEAPGAVYEDLTQSEKIPTPPSQLGFGAPAAVLRNRPDVRQAEASLLADGAQLGLARTQLLPLVRLTGNVSTQSTGLDELFDIITGGLFANVAQLIFDGGRTSAQIDGAEAQVEVSLAGWEQSILLALEDVESASVAFQAAGERVALFEEVLEATQNAAIIARNQYQAGLIDFETLLIAENQLLSSRNSLAAAEAELANAFVTLTQALGGGWQDEETRNLATTGEEIAQ